jgi:hypothetical protein
VRAIVPNPAFADISDDELVAYTDRLSQVVTKRLAAFAAFPLLMLPVIGLIFFGDRLGVPAYAPMVLILVAYVGSLPLVARVRRGELCRDEAVLELVRRGLPRPQGTERVTPASLDFKRHSRLPMTIMATSLVCVFVLLTGLMAELLPVSVSVLAPISALLGVTFVSLFWVVLLMLRAYSGARR